MTGGLSKGHNRLRLVHRIPGRIRVKYRDLKGNPGLAHHIHRTLSSAPGIDGAETSATTGSITIHHAPHLSWHGVVANIIERVGLAAVELTPEEVEAILGITESAEGPLLGEAIAEIGNVLIEKTSKVWVRAGHLTPLLGLIIVLLGAREFLRKA